MWKLVLSFVILQFTCSSCDVRVTVTPSYRTYVVGRNEEDPLFTCEVNMKGVTPYWTFRRFIRNGIEQRLMNMVYYEIIKNVGNMRKYSNGGRNDSSTRVTLYVAKPTSFNAGIYTCNVKEIAKKAHAKLRVVSRKRSSGTSFTVGLMKSPSLRCYSFNTNAKLSWSFQPFNPSNVQRRNLPPRSFPFQSKGKLKDGRPIVYSTLYLNPTNNTGAYSGYYMCKVDNQLRKKFKLTVYPIPSYYKVQVKVWPRKVVCRRGTRASRCSFRCNVNLFNYENELYWTFTPKGSYKEERVKYERGISVSSVDSKALMWPSSNLSLNIPSTRRRAGRYTCHVNGYPAYSHGTFVVE